MCFYNFFDRTFYNLIITIDTKKKRSTTKPCGYVVRSHFASICLFVINNLYLILSLPFLYNFLSIIRATIIDYKPDKVFSRLFTQTLV